jgi:hypothetical protein
MSWPAAVLHAGAAHLAVDRGPPKAELAGRRRRRQAGGHQPQRRLCLGWVERVVSRGWWEMAEAA